MTNIHNKYVLKNRKTGKLFRKAPSRAKARQLKQQYNFKHDIVKLDTLEVVR